MNKDLELQLQEQFPSFFCDLYGDRRVTGLAHGLGCGDGWFNLIKETCQQLTDAGADLRFSQIKEKFGSLRMYYTGEAQTILPIVVDAERRSLTICEQCGKTEGGQE